MMRDFVESHMLDNYRILEIRAFLRVIF